MAQFLPKPYKREPVTVRLSNEKLERIDSLAAAFHISRSELINQCIDFALEQMEEEVDEKNIRSYILRDQVKAWTAENCIQVKE